MFDGVWNSGVASKAGASSAAASRVYSTIETLLAAPVGAKHSTAAAVRGYHAANDGGGGDFDWVEGDTSDVDDGIVFASTHPDAPAGRWIRRVVNGAVSSAQFGAVADCTGRDQGTDDRDRLNALLAYTAANGYQAVITKGKYRITMAVAPTLDPLNPCGIVIPSGADVYCEPGVEFWPDAVNNRMYYVILSWDTDDWRWIGGHVKGERYDHLPNTPLGEWGMGFAMRGSRRADVVGVKSDSNWGDGFYIGSSPARYWCEDIRLTDVAADDNRRQGISLVSGKRVRIKNPRLTNTGGVGGTPPMAGIDIEPDPSAGHVLENIHVEDASTAGNSGSGVLVFIAENVAPASVLITNPRSYDDAVGFSFRSRPNAGWVTVDGLFAEEAWTMGARAWLQGDDGAHLTLNNPHILNPNTDGSAATVYGSGIAVFAEASEERASIGGVTVNRAIVEDTRGSPTMTRAIYVGNLWSSGVVKNVSIIDPVRLAGYTTSPLAFSVREAARLSDKYEQLRLSMANADYLMGVSNLYTTLSNENFTALRTVTLPAFEVPGLEYTFEVVAPQILRIAPNSGQSIRGEGSTGDGKYIQSNDRGARITLRRISETTWHVVHRTGTWVWEGGSAHQTVASAATLTLGVGAKVVTVTGTTNITSITATGFSGAIVTFVFQGALTLTDGGNLKLASDYTTAANSTLTLACDGTNWWEVSRVTT